MSNRVQLNDEFLEGVVGGKITFDWDGAVGHCGLNGDKSYTFTDKGQFVAFVTNCFKQGMKDSECLNALVAAGIIHK